jgi:hypothetical protein
MDWGEFFAGIFVIGVFSFMMYGVTTDYPNTVLLY